MGPPLSFKLFVIVSVLGLLVWACFFAGRGVVDSIGPTTVHHSSALPSAGREIRAPPTQQVVPDSTDQHECGFDQYTYPEWPEGFNVSVNALFVIGANPG